MHILGCVITMGYQLEEINLYRSERFCFRVLGCWPLMSCKFWVYLSLLLENLCFFHCFIHPLSFLSLQDLLPPTVSPLACFAFEAGFHSLKLDLVLVLNSSESHSGLDATAAREIQLVRGPLWGNSYFFWFIPSFCGAFALPGMEFYAEHIVTSSWFLAVPKCRCYLMTPSYCACGSFSLLCQPTCPSFLSPGFLWCPSQELPAGQLHNGNTVVPGKVLLCGGAPGTLRNSALQPVWQRIQVKYWGNCSPSHWKHIWVLWHFPKEVFKPLLCWESRPGKRLETGSFPALRWKRKDLLELFPALQFLGAVGSVSPEKFFVLSLFLSSAQQLPSHSSPRICADTVIIVVVLPSGEYPSPCRIWED